MQGNAKWNLVKARGRSVVIRDVGGNNDLPIEKDADHVVNDVLVKGLLREGVQLYFLDRYGALAQLKHSSGVFTGLGRSPEDNLIPDIGLVR